VARPPSSAGRRGDAGVVRHRLVLVEEAAAVRAEVGAAKDGGAARAALGALAAVEQLVDLGEPGVDAHHLRAPLVHEVVPPLAPAVHLDHEPPEVVEALVAGLQQGPALAAEDTRMRTARGDGRDGLGLLSEGRHGHDGNGRPGGLLAGGNPYRRLNGGILRRGRLVANMQKLALVLVAILAVPAVAFGARDANGDGSLAVTHASGTIFIQGRGVI
jgi:hypothetical protein